MNVIADVNEPVGTAASRLRGRLMKYVITSGQEFLADKNGNPQEWLVDLRAALLDGETLDLITESFWAGFAPSWPFQIVAQELAAVPLLGALLVKGAARGFATTGVILRSERKTYGRQRLIEGELTRDPVVFVDDLFFTGASLTRAADILSREGLVLRRFFTIVDFETIPGYRVLGARNIGLDRLFCAADLGLADKMAPPKPKPTAPSLPIAWRFAPGERRFSFVSRKSAPVLSGSHLLHASEDGFLTALHPESGDIIWAFAAAKKARKGVWSTPCVDRGRVYVGSYDGVVLCLDMQTGAELWRFDGADWVGSSPAVSACGQKLFIGLEYAAHGGSGGILCLDAATGAPIWEHRVPSLVHASPALLGDGSVACGANDGAVRCLDAETGALRWRTQLGGAVKGGLASDGGTLYAGDSDGAVTALDATSGAVRWQHATGGAIYSAPILHDGRVVVSSTAGLVLTLERTTGEVRARASFSSKVFSAPAVCGDSLLVGNTAGILTRLRWPDLASIGEYSFPERIVSEVCVGPRHIFVPTFDGQLFGLSREEKVYRVQPP